MRGASAVGVHDDLSAGKAGVACRTADDELAGRVDVEDEVGVEQRGCLLVETAYDLGNEDVPYVILYPLVHRFVGVELVVLGGNDDRVYPDRMVGLVEFKGVLGLRVGPEIGHQLRLVVADVREHLEGQVRKVQGEGHVLLGRLAGISEHHALVAGPLQLGVFPFHSAVDVAALLVDFRKDSAGVAVEHVLGIVIAYAVDDAAHRVADVDVGVRAHLSSHEDETGGAEGFAGYLGFRVLTQEFVEDRI